jgi:hypothetical protein
LKDKLVTVARFNNSVDAHLAKMRLDENGIESALMGEDSANMLPIPQVAFIELCVVSEQVDEAIRILNSKE